MFPTTPSRSKEGLNDPRVAHCYDRGSRFLVEDVRDSKRSRPNGVTHIYESSQSLMIRIRTELSWSLLTPGWGGVRVLYAPQKKLYEIITPERLRIILTDLYPQGQPEPETFIKAVLYGGHHCGTIKRPTVKLLAILICCKALDQYVDLVERQGISDFCLPPAYRNNDHTQPFECQSHHCETRHTFLGNMELMDRHEIYRWAYSLSPPYFKKPGLNTAAGGNHNHYILNEDDTLPIISSREQTPKQSHQFSGPNPAGSQGMYEGGFSTVTKVEFHSDQYDFGTYKGEKYKYFALKRLNASDAKSFSDELASLLTFNTEDNEHLVKLLLSFEVREKGGNTRYYLLFPWADGTLWDFWKLNDAANRRADFPRWMSEQCYRLVGALQIFHNERARQLPRFPDIANDDKELYGRHGDIKADNILWFAKQKQLVLNDFGLARLHSKISRSAQDPKGMARTETYRAPEFDIPGSKISRVSDIFSLGCAFLEFATWLLEGFHSASETFVDARSEPDPYMPGFKIDTFFQIDEVSGKTVPSIKPKVRYWIKRLRTNPKCTQYIEDFLDLIEDHMLHPNPQERWNSGRVQDKLRVLRQTCHTDSNYWKDPIKRR